VPITLDGFCYWMICSSSCSSSTGWCKLAVNVIYLFMLACAHVMCIFWRHFVAARFNGPGVPGLCVYDWTLTFERKNQLWFVELSVHFISCTTKVFGLVFLVNSHERHYNLHSVRFTLNSSTLVLVLLAVKLVCWVCYSVYLTNKCKSVTVLRNFTFAVRLLK